MNKLLMVMFIVLTFSGCNKDANVTALQSTVSNCPVGGTVVVTQRLGNWNSGTTTSCTWVKE